MNNCSICERDGQHHRCDVCGQSVHTTESYHKDGDGVRHIDCEFPWRNDGHKRLIGFEFGGAKRRTTRKESK